MPFTPVGLRRVPVRGEAAATARGAGAATAAAAGAWPGRAVMATTGTDRPLVPTAAGADVAAAFDSRTTKSYAGASVGGPAAWVGPSGGAECGPISATTTGGRLPVVPATVPGIVRSYGCMRPPDSGTKTILFGWSAVSV